MATAVRAIADKKDIQKGWIAAIISIAIIIIYLFLFTFEMADPPPQEYVMQTETVFPEELDLKNLKVDVGNSGSGSPTDDPIAEPKPQVEEVLSTTKPSNTKTNSGKSNKTNSKTNSNNTATTTTQSNNPFGTGGNNGKQGSGNSPFGNDTGTGGDGPGGPGGGEGRTRLNDPETGHIIPDKDAVVHLKVTINANGDIISVVNNPSKTTTTDQRIINQVIAAVKKDVRYSKSPGSPNAIQFITVKLYAQ